MDSKFILDIRIKTYGWLARNSGAITNSVGAGRNFGISDCTKNQTVAISSTKEPGIVSNATLKGSEGGVYTYTVNDDGTTIFSIANGVSITKIEVTDPSTSAVAYKVEFVNEGGVAIKETAEHEGEPGEAATLTAADKAEVDYEGKRYVYASDNSGETTIASDGSTVVTVVFREAALYAYSVVTSLGDTIATGKAYEGSSVTAHYGRFALDGTTLYGAAKQGSNPWWGKVFTVGEDNHVETIAYSKKTEGVVFFMEAEEIAGATASSSANADIRCSMGKGGFFAEETALTTLEPGLYTLTTSVWGNAGTTFTFVAGEDVALEATTTGSIADATSESFAVAASGTTVAVKAAGDKNHVLDFVYIVKTADESVEAPEITVDGCNVGIEATAANTGAKVEIRYTTDGSEPDESSTLYEEELNLTEECTVKAIAISVNGTKSAVSSAAVELNPTAVGSIKTAPEADESTYTLDGAKVGGATRGLLIRGGKLILVK